MTETKKRKNMDTQQSKNKYAFYIHPFKIYSLFQMLCNNDFGNFNKVRSSYSLEPQNWNSILPIYIKTQSGGVSCSQ